jgi:hypothetical protein
MTLDVINAYLYLGVDDTQFGFVSLYGHAAGNTSGGRIAFYTAADHDTTVSYYTIKATSDQLHIGPDTDADAIIVDGSNTWSTGYLGAGIEPTNLLHVSTTNALSLSALSDSYVYINNISDAGTITAEPLSAHYGIRHVFTTACDKGAKAFTAFGILNTVTAAAAFNGNNFGAFSNNATIAAGATVSTSIAGITGLVQYQSANAVASLYGTSSTMAMSAGSATTTYSFYNYSSFSGSTITAVTTAYGLYNYIYASATTGAGFALGTAYGGFNKIETGGATSTITTAYCTYSSLLNTSGTITTGYLFYGVASGVVGTSWGIYLTGEAKNYFSHMVGIGMSPLADLLQVGDGTNYTQIDGDGDITQVGTARIDWTKKTAASLTLTAGTSAETVTDLQSSHDGTFYHITEAAATPGIDMYVEFTGITAFNWVHILGSYNGSSSHAVAIQLYDWTLAGDDWETWGSLQTAFEDVSTADGIILQNHSFFIPSDSKYIGTAGGDAGKVRVRFYHTMGGSAAHDLYLDVVALYQ